jgi:CRISPR/Cas system-associated exonuclease Cas4 (RecB family)
MSHTNHLFTQYLLNQLANAAHNGKQFLTHLSPHHVAIIQHLIQTPLFEQNDFVISLPVAKHEIPQDIPSILPSDVDAPSWQRPHYNSPIPLTIITLNQLKQSSKDSDYKRHLHVLKKQFPEHLKPTLFQHIDQGASLFELVQISPDTYTPNEHKVAKIISNQPLAESHFIRLSLNNLWQLHQCIYHATQPPLTHGKTIVYPGIFSISGLKKIKEMNWHASNQSPENSHHYQHPELNSAPPLPDPFPTTLSPSALLTYQECPFRFFAKHVLKIPQPQTEESQYFSQFGELIHLIWAKYKKPSNEQVLKEINDNTHFTQFSQHLKHALANHILHIVNEWQTIEESRPYFKTIAREKDVSYTHANITLKGRIDRIDQLDEPSHLIIDYKSTKPSLNWYQETLHQLPIYAIMYGKKTKGLAYAQLKKNQCQLSGHISEDMAHAPLIAMDDLGARYNIDSWNEAWQKWEHQLHELMRNISSSPLPPQPNSAKCSECEFKPLCRAHLEAP